MNATATRKINARWFKDRLEDKQMSQAKLAELLNLDGAAVTRWLKGARKMRVEELASVATILGVSLDDVATNAGFDFPEARKGAVPLIGVIDAQGVLARGAMSAPRRASRPPQVPESTVAARFEPGMSASGGMDGWVAYWAPAGNKIALEGVGRLCVVKVTDGPEIVGVVKTGYSRGTFNVWPWLPGSKVLENVFLESCAPVLWVKMGPEG